MPFITEELWSITGVRTSLLVHSDWPQHLDPLWDEASNREMTWVTTLIDDIRSARAQMHVPVGLKLPMLSLNMDDTVQPYWNRNAPLIHRLARIDSLTAADKAPKGAITIAVAGATFAILLDGIIDIAEEKARLTKTLDKLNKEIAGLNARLNNPNFATSAPEDVVMEARTNLEARMDEAGKLQAALSRLAEIA
jgi:valyl-tRNA synthetase